MAHNFCAHCGNRLPGETGFCDQCGHPVAKRAEARSRSPVSALQAYESAGTKVRAPGTYSSPPSPAPAPPPPIASPNRPVLGASVGNNPAELPLELMSEPNERAFTILVPKGWKIIGGVYRLNPQEVNGPGNSLAPKCEFTVKSDDRGTIMIRWHPDFSYVDPNFAPTGAAFFQPGQWYQGMPVRPLVSAKQFLNELLYMMRPQASDLTIVREDPLAEVTARFDEQARQVNMSLQQQGLSPMRFESLLMLVEYTEGGQRFRETVRTTIADSRASSLMWTNENTLMMRAPAADFDSWMPVLNKIQQSPETSKEWLNKEWSKANQQYVGGQVYPTLQPQQGTYPQNVGGQVYPTLQPQQGIYPQNMGGQVNLTPEMQKEIADANWDRLRRAKEARDYINQQARAIANSRRSVLAAQGKWGEELSKD